MLKTYEVSTFLDNAVKMSPQLCCDRVGTGDGNGHAWVGPAQGPGEADGFFPVGRSGEGEDAEF